MKPGLEDFSQDLNLILTEDGSPSLNWAAGETTETMHSRQGARSETDYIYGEALRWLKTHGPSSPRVLIMGLGLGYIEMFTASLLADVEITSVEVDDHLRERFKLWLEGEDLTPYENVVLEVEKATSVSSLKELCRQLYSQGKWSFIKELKELDDQKFEGIMYDAFSGQSQPDLWSEVFLSELLCKHAAPTCILSTYAATGDLKRALQKNHFNCKSRAGFAHKRESTWATRCAD